MTNNEERCENCRFMREGSCRVNPPVGHWDTDRTIFIGFFPLVSTSEWCGEHQWQTEVEG